MTETQHQIADILLTAAVVGVGLVTGSPLIATVVGGIGINLASELTRSGWHAACQRLLGSSGLLNHDLQQALARAFRQALAHLEHAWWETPDAKHLRRVEPDVARETAEVFKMMRDDAVAFCCADGLGRAIGNEQVRQLLYGDEIAAHRALTGCLSDYLRGHDPTLIAFLDTHLVQALAFWFGEELKADRADSNRAWRAFQCLLLEGLQSGLAEVQVEQRETQQILVSLRSDLQAWTNRMDALSDDVREHTGEEELRQALTGVRDDLLAAIAAEAGLTRAAIEAGLEQVAQLLSEELARLRLDLLPLLGKHGLIEGQAPLRADLRRHFDVLLRDYALFGGRVDEMETINGFLTDPQGSYLYLTGSSGYGKTAILVQLAGQGEAVYHFLSRAYGTADEDLFLRDLCQQLAARHSLGGQFPMSTAELRALYPNLLRLPPADGRPVVVLIDGLDEAANWEPGPLHFPSDLPNGVKVIFSARQMADQDWLARLHLSGDRVHQLVLGAMSADDVRSLLLAAGGAAAPLADDTAWIAQVLRLSAGDPFYVKLLVDDVCEGRMQSEQIEAQPAGLDAYLKGWWDQVATAVRAQDVRDVLGNLAVARGPLGRDDLVAMFPELSWVLDGVLSEVRRFVIGNERQGYALCHPRFADYVRRRVGTRVLQTYTDALLNYCANWREHHSPYVLAHYAGHLAEAGRWEELHTLVATGGGRQEWADARFTAEEGSAGYLTDLGLAWTHADMQGRTDPSAIGRQVRYAMVSSSLHSIADAIPVSLVENLIDAGIWTAEAGLAYAKQVTDPTQRVKALASVARHSVIREPAIREALRTLTLDNEEFRPPPPEGALEQLLGPTDCRAKLLETVAALLPDSMVSEVTKWLHSMEREAIEPGGDWIEWSDILLALTPRFVELGRLSELLEMAKSFPQEWGRAKTLQNLAMKFAELGRVDEADQVIECIPDPDGEDEYSVQLLRMIVEQIEARPKSLSSEEQPSIKDLPPTPELKQQLVLGQALRQARVIDDRSALDSLFLELVPHLPLSEFGALKVAVERIDHPILRAEALIRLLSRGEKSRRYFVRKVLSAIEEAERDLPQQSTRADGGAADKQEFFRLSPELTLRGR